jgi:LacI family transcriptional regulator
MAAACPDGGTPEQWGKNKMKVGIRDIAREAEVSAATVSNALNLRRGVNPETARRIEAIALKMGYSREPAAALRKCIRFVLYKKHGLVVMDTPFFAQLIEGIEQECRLHGYEMIVNHMSGQGDPGRVREVAAAKDMALLLLATEMDLDDIAPFLEAKVPMLLLDNDFPSLNVNTVVMDNYGAGLAATGHMIKCGHQDIGFLGSSRRFENMSQREAGYRAALQQAGLDTPENGLVYVEPTMEGAYRDMSALLQDGRALPAAFFAGNDIIAVGAARALKSRGFRLPEDVSMVGMDDLPLSRVVNPPLTTVSVPKKAIGRIAVRRLMGMMAAPDDEVQKTRVGVSLIVRGSVMNKLPK